MTASLVRRYQAADREAVRRICHLTGYMGESAAWFWRDAESFADMWTGYYTDYEPESCFVAEAQGRVAGYLVGCLDTAKAADPAAVCLSHVGRRGLVFRPGTAGFLWRSAWDTVRDRRGYAGRFLDARWPAHLHMNLLPEARGGGLGRALMDAFIEHVAAAGVPGIHLETLAENTWAIAFFRAMGFTAFGEPKLVPGMRTRAGARMHGQLMVRGGAGSPAGGQEAGSSTAK
ncbi:MAG: GNAT family N-acetyltransferase [Planctomycetes bacterium]|nr:GNAT family N-acetyltransferase [Planctomycetota bacterium]